MMYIITVTITWLVVVLTLHQAQADKMVKQYGVGEDCYIPRTPEDKIPSKDFDDPCSGCEPPIEGTPTVRIRIHNFYLLFLFY